MKLRLPRLCAVPHCRRFAPPGCQCCRKHQEVEEAIRLLLDLRRGGPRSTVPNPSGGPDRHFVVH